MVLTVVLCVTSLATTVVAAKVMGYHESDDWMARSAAGSKLPLLGYTVPCAIENILLTAWRPVVVMLTR